MSALAFGTEALGYLGCMLAGALPTNPLAWLCFIGAALIGGAAGAWLVSRQVLRPMQALAAETEALQDRLGEMDTLVLQVSENQSRQRQLRHDIRGALSPALLMADRLTGHTDPAVKRSGDIVVRAVENAIALLADGPRPSA